MVVSPHRRICKTTVHASRCTRVRVLSEKEKLLVAFGNTVSPTIKKMQKHVLLLPSPACSNGKNMCICRYMCTYHLHGQGKETIEKIRPKSRGIRRVRYVPMYSADPFGVSRGNTLNMSAIVDMFLYPGHHVPTGRGWYPMDGVLQGRFVVGSLEYGGCK